MANLKLNLDISFAVTRKIIEELFSQYRIETEKKYGGFDDTLMCKIETIDELEAIMLDMFDEEKETTN